MKTIRLFATLSVLLIAAASAWAVARPIAVSFDESANPLPFITERAVADRLDDPGDPVDFDAALLAAGNYLRQFQSDITEDNAGNGSGGSESPDDPEDGGWDWVLNWDTDPHFHSTAASPTNTYGATAQGLYWTYLKAPNATLWTALLDAADHMVAVGPNVIRSGADMKFLLLFDDLYDTEVAPTSVYADAARAKYDGRITFYGSATALAAFIRDARNSQGYPNGLIAWDVGIFAVVAQMLHDRYPGNGYDADADAVADVLWQDSFNDSPGYFDVVDDQGYDAGYANANFWMYNLGLTGLIDAFDASGSHTTDLPWLLTTLLASQTSEGAFCYQYGVHAGDEDWQSTAYAAMTLHEYDASAYATEIAHAAYWTGATQHAGGGWVYDDGDHYTEIGGENTVALSFGEPADEVWVDDDWTSQADVDASPYAGLVWGYDAFGTIQAGIVNVGNSIVNVLAGLYHERLSITQSLDLRGAQYGVDPTPGGARTNPANESVVDVVGLSVPNPDVMIEIPAGVTNASVSGFTLNGGQSLPHNADQSAIRCWDDNIVIQDNIIDGFNAVIYKGNDYFSFLRNRVTANKSGIVVQPNLATNVTISGNRIALGTSPAGDETGIYFTGVNPSLISDNTVTGFLTGRALQASNVTNVSITGNSFTGNRDGISIFGSSTFITINENVLSSNTRYGINIKGQDISIANNFIENNSNAGISVDFHVLATERVTVYENRFSGNSFFDVFADIDVYQTVDASGNWWGDNTAAGVASSVSGLVDYTPWLDSGTDTGDPGFQGDFSTLWVDDDSPQSRTTGRIQEGVNSAVGSTVNVAAGTYEEQVHITTNNLNLVGAGVGSTFIQAPNGMPLYFATSLNNFPVIFVDGAIGVTVSDLTVDGLGRGNSNYRFIGIGYWNAGGAINDVHVTNIMDTPFSGAQHGVGIYAFNSTAGPFTLNVTDVTVDNYQKNAFALNGNDNLTTNLLRVTTTGAGATGVTAQNGIQIWGGTGTVNDCDVTGNAWTGGTWSAAGYLFIESDVDVSGGCTSTGNQVGFNYLETSGSITGGTITGGSSTPDYSSAVDVTSYTAGVSMGHVLPQPLFDEHQFETTITPRLDDPGDEVVVLSGVTMTGASAVNSYGVYAYNEVDVLDLTVDDCNISAWETGLLIQQVSGSIAPAVFSDNDLSNTNNAWDNSSGHTYNNNCWSDFGTNSGFPVQYDVTGGGGNADYNPSTDCANIDLVVSSPYIGCNVPCRGDTLYITFDGVGYLAAQLFVVLPAGLDADWAAGTQFEDVEPSSNAATNLMFAGARRVAGNQIEVNVQWGPPYSDGDDSKYIACLPLVATSANAHGTDFTISLSATYTFWDIVGPHSGLFSTGITGLTVDCDIPAASLTGGAGEAGCNAYNSETEFLGQVNVAMNALGLGGAPTAPLSSAYIALGATQWTIPTSDGAWPTGSEIPNVWLAMVEGCNTFVLHVFDTECNEATSTLLDVVKDVTKPTLTVTMAGAPCLNNISGDPQYGGTELDDYLDISTDLAAGALAGCYAATGTVSFESVSNPGSPYVVPIPPDLALFPTAADVLAFWNWIISRVPAANGNETFNVSALDCAGNYDGNQFTVCIDVTNPDNEFTLFDARPTHLGVWLKWSWDYSATQATNVEIYRKGEGDYPVYHSEFWSDDLNYDKVHASLSGWTLVTTQDGSVASTSGAHPGTHAVADANYWLDRDVTWDVSGVDNEARDIYRYVTFVKDAGGNWSQVSSYAIGTNADRSTNYWLGDYSMDVVDDPNGSTGSVESADLTLLSQDYFEQTVDVSGTAANGIDIGAENAENGFGKGIPSPDGWINFQDLVPFSFNFGVVSAGGFNIQTPRTNPEDAMDAAPVVTLARANNNLLEVGAEFEVVISLAGNSGSSVKALEAALTFDPQVLELIDVSSNAGDVYDGVAWSTAKQIAGPDDRIGVAAAAMGEIASFVGDFTLATVTFRWIDDRAPETALELESYRTATVFGDVYEGEGSTLNFGATGVIPTEYALHQNYPNPFNPTTQIHFDLPEAVAVQLIIYNIMGQEVRTLVSAAMPAGAHVAMWDGLDNSGRLVGSGMYLYRISAGPLHDIKKMLLAR